MAFLPIKQWAEQDTESYIAANANVLGQVSSVFQVGDAVIFSTQGAIAGFVQNAAASTGALVYGIVVGFKASPGGSSQLNLQSSTLSVLTTNQSVDQYRVQVLPARQSRLFLADLTQTSGVTAWSVNPGFFALSTTNGKLDETTYKAYSQQLGAPPGFQQFFSTGSGGAANNNTVVGLFPATSTQVIGYFTNLGTI